MIRLKNVFKVAFCLVMLLLPFFVKAQILGSGTLLGLDLNPTFRSIKVDSLTVLHGDLNLENDLKNKIEELDKQKKLEEKVLAFEERLSNTEKTNSEQIELENKIYDIEYKIKSTHENIFVKNKDIEKKTNYIEKKINSYDNQGNVNNSEVENKIEVNSSDVVDIRTFDNEGKKTQDQSDNNKKRKKFRFFFFAFSKLEMLTSLHFSNFVAIIADLN